MKIVFGVLLLSAAYAMHGKRARGQSEEKDPRVTIPAKSQLNPLGASLANAENSTKPVSGTTKSKAADLWNTIVKWDLGPTQRDIDLALTRSILSVLYRFKDTYNDTKNWHNTYFSSIIKRMKSDIAELEKSEAIKVTSEPRERISKIYGFDPKDAKYLLGCLKHSKKSAEEYWGHHNQKLKSFLHAFEHFQKYEDDADYRTKAAKFFTISKTVLKVIYLATVAGLGAGGGLVLQGKEVCDWLGNAANYTKEIDLLLVDTLEGTEHLVDLCSQDFGTTSLRKAMRAEEDGDYMNYRVKMDNTNIFKVNSTPEEVLKEWIETYLDTGAQLQFRELSECERAKQLENRFRLQNLFSERTLPPQGVKFEDDKIIKEQDDGIHRTYVERFVFVAHAKADPNPKAKSPNVEAIENFRAGLEKLDSHTYIGLNPYTSYLGQNTNTWHTFLKIAPGIRVELMDSRGEIPASFKGKIGTVGEQQSCGKWQVKMDDGRTALFNKVNLGPLLKDKLVGCMEFKRPMQLWHKKVQGLHYGNRKVGQYLDILSKTHYFTLYHLGKGNGKTKVSAQEEIEWVPTRDWQKLPIIRQHIRKEIKVEQNTSQLNDLEIFKRAAVAVDQTKEDNKWRNFKFDDITPKPMTTDPDQEDQLKSSQFGYPCEFKTPVFMEPFKFYKKHEEGIRLVHGREENFKLHHRMQIIRTITDGNMLNKEGVELQRTRALDMLIKKVKDLDQGCDMLTKKVKVLEARIAPGIRVQLVNLPGTVNNGKLGTVGGRHSSGEWEVNIDNGSKIFVEEVNLRPLALTES